MELDFKVSEWSVDFVFQRYVQFGGRRHPEYFFAMITRDSIALKCEVVIPHPETPVRSVLDRWSDVGLSRPALVVVPDTEQDIIDAILYAKNTGLELIPGGGGHGPFVPITDKTLYLDMKRFDKVVLDTSQEQARISFGGGALTRRVIDVCTSEGFYTTWTNSYGVGMVGSVLGGGSVSSMIVSAKIC